MSPDEYWSKRRPRWRGRSKTTGPANFPDWWLRATVTRYGYSVPCRHIEIIESAHPVPDAASLTAAQRILDKVKNLGAEDQVLWLISGGETTVTLRGNGRDGRKTEFLLSSKSGIGIAKPTGMKIIGNCALLKNRKHHQFENLSSLHTFSAGLI